MTPRSILCPVDFSEQSRAALLWASGIARQRGAGLTVLSVVEPLLARAAGIRLSLDLPRDEAMPALREFVENTLTEQGRQHLRIRIEVAVGHPSREILSAARKQRAGLIVMGTHGRGAIGRLLLGSTTEEVLRQTEWPVLAVPDGAVDVSATQPPGTRLRLILAATDFGESATAAVRWAAELAADVNASLVLAHVIEPVVVPQPFQELSADVENDRVTSGRRRLAELSAGFRDTQSECVVSVGSPADAIASLALEREASLVVLGLASADDAKQNRPGAIAYRILRAAHVAIVVVPPGPLEDRAGVRRHKREAP